MPTRPSTKKRQKRNAGLRRSITALEGIAKRNTPTIDDNIRASIAGPKARTVPMLGTIKNYKVPSETSARKTLAIKKSVSKSASAAASSQRKILKKKK